MNKTIVRCLLACLWAVAVLAPASAAEPVPGKRKPAQVLGTPVRTHFNINNISTVLKNDGKADIDVAEQNSGFVFPKGSRKTAVFQSGFLWGVKVPGDAPPGVRLGGSAYRSGLQGGKILSPGVAEDPDLDKNRIYRVRPDIRPGVDASKVNVSSETGDGEGSAAAVVDQYIRDWNEWPAGDGAPYVDKDGNGSYDPAVDVPGVQGADQTLWFVCNDLDSNKTKDLYGAKPLGIELQVTAWGYSQQGALGNVLFKKYLMINKSNMAFDSMYVSQWADIDLGNSTDDFSGCDTTRSIGFTYNANPVDGTYDPLPPPVSGFDFFQGPIVPAAGRTAIYKGGYKSDYRNLPMTAFYYFARGDANVVDPTQGDIAGSGQFYNFFRGRIGLTGKPFTDPKTLVQTPFTLSGDAETGAGWVDGQALPAGDRRQGLASGPFTMGIGDTQEVVVGEIAAGAIPGVDRLGAIGLFKYFDDQAQVAYDNFFNLCPAPPPPIMTVTELDKEIVLDWGSDLAQVDKTESFACSGFRFQGYNVYQLPSKDATIEKAARVATFDITDGVGKIRDRFFDTKTKTVEVTVKQFGTDQGLKRYLDITSDALKSGAPLVNGIRYYFAVTSYCYTSDPAVTPNNIENPLDVKTIVPHSSDPGYRYHAAPDDYLSNVDHPSGIANAAVRVRVVDPKKLTGQPYSIGWSTQPDKFAGSYISPEEPEVEIGHVEMQGFMGLNEAGDSLFYRVTITNYDSLTGPIIASHFHNGGPDTTGPVVKNLNFTYSTVLGKQVATVTGFWRTSDSVQPLTPALLSELIAGNVYANIHTSAHPTGEIRMQMGVDSYPWYLDRGATRMLSYQQNYSLDSAYKLIDGLQVLVGNLSFAAPITIFGASQTHKANPDTPDLVLWGDGYAALDASGTFGSPSGKASDFWGAGGGLSVLTDFVQDIELRFTGVPDPAAADPNDARIISGGSFASIRSRSAPTGGSVATNRIRVPFEVWEVERNRQINCVIVERNADATSPWGDTGTPLWFRMAGREYITFVATPYDPDSAGTLLLRTDAHSTWTTFFESGEHLDVAHWDTGDQYTIVYANPIVAGTDFYSFTAPQAQSYDRSIAQNDIGAINVFPNPYYGVNTEEINKYQRFVTFTHLPVRATIRLFNLSGVLVKTIIKSDASQFQRWDLTNESNLPVASGIYIAHIAMPDIGAEKIIKVAIIQEQQFLDRF